jgi:hypothetical protein
MCGWVFCALPRTKNTINTTMPGSSPSLVCGVGWVWSVESDTILSGEVAAPVENTTTAHSKKNQHERTWQGMEETRIENMKKKKLYFGEMKIILKNKK